MKKLLRFIFAIIIVILLCITTLGYIEYKTVLAEQSLEDKISEIQSKQNYVQIEDVSEYLIKATVSTEDQRFYEHNGIDFIAYGRILYTIITTGELNSGGSTITQQLAKNMYFGFEPSLIRKVAELFMTNDIETHYDKDDILELYINIINYGDNHMGIYEASTGYFNKYPIDLTFNEATLVAGIPQSPSNYQLSNHADMAKRRQKVVLQTLIDTGVYTEEEIEELMKY